MASFVRRVVKLPFVYSCRLSQFLDKGGCDGGQYLLAFTAHVFGDGVSKVVGGIRQEPAPRRQVVLPDSGEQNILWVPVDNPAAENFNGLLRRLHIRWSHQLS